MSVNKDYLVQVQVKNGRLHAAMVEKFGNAAALARAAGVSASQVGRLLSMKDAATDKTGELTKTAEKVCVALNKMPCELFNDVQMFEGLEKNKGEFYADDVQINNLIAEAGSPCKAIEMREYLDVMDGVLDTLTEQERSVITRRFGIDCNEQTATEISESMGVSITRILQIEAKAMRKLRHPTRSGLIAESPMGVFVDRTWNNLIKNVSACQ